MITDTEFVAIRAFDRTLRENTNAAERIINMKNTRLVAFESEILRLRAALRVEIGKRRHAELQLTAMRRH